jgi:hypothetical protein
MEHIIEPTIDYDFSKLYLGPPSTVGGAYFTRIMYNNNKPLYIQTPKSLTKQGFIKSGKKMYADLMFDNNDTVFINWMENLEAKCQELIFSKGQSWFETKLEKEDIESAFTSPLKIFKSGKFYLLRVNIKPNIKIYNENDVIISSDDISPEKTIISILEVQGIKFTSRNFQIEIELKQSMVVSPDPFLDECFIRKPIKKQSSEPLVQLNITDTNDTNDTHDTNDTKYNNVTLDLDAFVDDSVNDLEVSNSVPTDSNSHINLDVEFTEEPEFKESQPPSLDNLVEESIDLEVEELTPSPKTNDSQLLEEVNPFIENSLETITLKKPNQVYYEIYKKAREKAKEAKKTALLAYLEMKNIKKTYMLDDIDDSESDNDLDNNEDSEEL